MARKKQPKRAKASPRVQKKSRKKLPPKKRVAKSKKTGAKKRVAKRPSKKSAAKKRVAKRLVKKAPKKRVAKRPVRKKIVKKRGKPPVVLPKPKPTRPSFPGPGKKTYGWAQAAEDVRKAREKAAKKARKKAPELTPQKALLALLKHAGASDTRLQRPRRRVEHFEGTYSSGWKAIIPIWDFFNKKTEQRIRKEVNAWKPRRRGEFYLVNLFCSVFSDAAEVRSYATVGMNAPIMSGKGAEAEKFRKFFMAQQIFASGKRTNRKAALDSAIRQVKADEANGFAIIFVQFLEVHSYREKTAEETSLWLSKQRRKAKNRRHGKATNNRSN